jgi:hypothetical protein
MAENMWKNSIATQRQTWVEHPWFKVSEKAQFQPNHLTKLENKIAIKFSLKLR